MRPLNELLRPNILRLQPYSSARDEFAGAAEVYLDANENPFASDVNRYPDPRQRELKAALADLREVQPAQLFLGNGSDEAIDLLLRAFCQPGQDRIVVCPPTYGMYAVSAGIQDAAVVSVPLRADFQPDLAALQAQFADPRNKLLFLCSPNNPTGNLIDPGIVSQILNQFPGIVVVDEAYIDFAPGASLIPQLNAFPNLVILQTFSKAWGLAGIRLGAAFAAPEIVAVLDRIKPPYNVNTLTQIRGMQALANSKAIFLKRDELLRNRFDLHNQLSQLTFVQGIFPSDANFLLVQFHHAQRIFQHLLSANIIVRDRTSQVPDCLRITVGTAAENTRLISFLRQLESSSSNPSNKVS